MTDENIKLLYKGKQFDSIVTARNCEYSGCDAPTERIMTFGGDVWQFCATHCNKVMTAMCHLDYQEKNYETARQA